jgi:hypothetical protein
MDAVCVRKCTEEEDRARKRGREEPMEQRGLGAAGKTGWEARWLRKKEKERKDCCRRRRRSSGRRSKNRS